MPRPSELRVRGNQRHFDGLASCGRGRRARTGAEPCADDGGAQEPAAFGCGPAAAARRIGFDWWAVERVPGAGRMRSRLAAAGGPASAAGGPASAAGRPASAADTTCCAAPATASRASPGSPLRRAERQGQDGAGSTHHARARPLCSWPGQPCLLGPGQEEQDHQPEQAGRLTSPARHARERRREPRPSPLSKVL